jgi:hypothetical protein
MFKTLFITVVILLYSVLTFAESSVTFTWNENTETDLAGYKLYQSDIPDGQVVGTDTPVAVIDPDSENYDHSVIPNLPDDRDAYTLTNVPDGTWYWILTAFDTESNESGKSNEVTATIDTTAPGSPSAVTIHVIIKVDVQ